MATNPPAPATQPPYAPPPRSSGVPTVVKVLIAVFVVFALLGGIGFYAIWKATGGPVKVADTFFTVTAKQGAQASWATASPAFQGATSPADWAAFVQRYNLSAYKTYSFNERSFENNTAHIKGSLTLTTGATLPVTVDFVKGPKDWLVQSVHLSDAGVAQSPSPAAAPTQTAAQPAPAGIATPPALTVAPPRPDAFELSALDVSARMISTANVGAMCMAAGRQNGVFLDDVTCPRGLPLYDGQTVHCVARRNGVELGMTARVDVFNTVTQHLNYTCQPDNRPDF